MDKAVLVFSELEPKENPGFHGNTIFGHEVQAPCPPLCWPARIRDGPLEKGRGIPEKKIKQAKK